MKVFVTGGNGFIGSVVVRKLVQKEHTVTCLLRTASRTQRIDDLPVKRVHGDIRDASKVKEGMLGCDATIHLAGLSSWNDINSPALEEVVEGGTRHVIEAAADLPGHRVIFVSTTTAINGSDKPQIFDESSEFTLSDPKLKYAHAKHRAEFLCLSAFRKGLSVVIVNPAEVYGPSDEGLITAGNLVDFSRANPVLVCNGGTSVVHVDDVATGIVAALEKGRAGERYILGGENVTIHQLAALYLQLAGQSSKIVTLPNRIIRTLTWIATQIGLPLPFKADVIPYATRYWFVDGSKAQRELGVKFRDARDTLLPTIEWLRQAGHLA